MNSRPDTSSGFGDRLVAVDPISSEFRNQLQQELHAMFVRELNTPRRLVYAVVAVLALVAAGVCGFLALTEPELPGLSRIGLSTGTLFGLAWAVVAGRVAWRGTVDVKQDGGRIASMVWVFTVLMMVFFMMAGMSMDDRLLGLTMIANGIAFLIGAGVCWLSYRIERSELVTREKLLEMELRLAELAERK